MSRCCLFTLVLGIVLGTLINTGVKAAKDGSTVASDATPITVPQATPVGNEFTKLAKRLEPSVVYIHSDYLVKPDKRAKQHKARRIRTTPRRPQIHRTCCVNSLGRTVRPKAVPARRKRHGLHRGQKRIYSDQRSRSR